MGGSKIRDFFIKDMGKTVWKWWEQIIITSQLRSVQVNSGNCEPAYLCKHFVD
jgi:hypothetical protein